MGHCFDCHEPKHLNGEVMRWGFFHDAHGDFFPCVIKELCGTLCVGFRWTKIDGILTTV